MHSSSGDEIKDQKGHQEKKKFNRHICQNTERYSTSEPTACLSSSLKSYERTVQKISLSNTSLNKKAIKPHPKMQKENI